jgi:hypothetical protein
MSMHRTVVGLLALVLFLPALWAFDEKDKPATPAEQYQALLKEYERAQQDYSKSWAEAKTPAEQNKVVQEKSPKVDKYTGRFLELAKKNPKDPVALDALVWVVRHGNSVLKDAAEAAEILVRDYVQDRRIDTVCQVVTYVSLPEVEKLLRAVLEKNPSHDVQGVACLALANRFRREALSAERDKNTAEAEKANRMADQLSERLAKDYADVGYLRTLVLSPNSSASPRAIRAFLEKTTDREAKGVGAYALALRLKKDAEQAAQKKRTAEVEQLNKEIEALLDQVVKEYADVAFGKLGDMAKGELNEIRHLAVGKQALDIEGEDIDGKRLKLSDYRGKVVLLDFWGNW